MNQIRCSPFFSILFALFLWEDLCKTPLQPIQVNPMEVIGNDITISSNIHHPINPLLLNCTSQWFIHANIHWLDESRDIHQEYVQLSTRNFWSSLQWSPLCDIDKCNNKWWSWYQLLLMKYIVEAPFWPNQTLSADLSMNFFLTIVNSLLGEIRIGHLAYLWKWGMVATFFPMLIPYQHMLLSSYWQLTFAYQLLLLLQVW